MQRAWIRIAVSDQQVEDANAVLAALEVLTQQEDGAVLMTTLLGKFHDDPEYVSEWVQRGGIIPVIISGVECEIDVRSAIRDRTLVFQIGNGRFRVHDRALHQLGEALDWAITWQRRLDVDLVEPLLRVLRAYLIVLKSRAPVIILPPEPDFKVTIRAPGRGDHDVHQCAAICGMFGLGLKENHASDLELWENRADSFMPSAIMLVPERVREIFPKDNLEPWYY